jgi:hypothetical protein
MKSVDPRAGAGGPGPRCCGHILRIFLKEIIPEILKITGISEFCKNNRELFHNYILVPIVLHLGPSLTFYNYN